MDFYAQLRLTYIQESGRTTHAQYLVVSFGDAIGTKIRRKCNPPDRNGTIIRIAIGKAVDDFTSLKSC